jgi:hypothetical protein
MIEPTASHEGLVPSIAAQHVRRSLGVSLQRSNPPRSAFVIVAVIVLFVISLTLFGIWAQSTVREHHRLRNRQGQLQATRLADAGLRRAAVQLRTDPQYTGEIWAISSDTLGGSGAADVRISILPADGRSPGRIEAAATYPAGASRRVQVTRSAILSPSGSIPPTQSE